MKIKFAFLILITNPGFMFTTSSQDTTIQGISVSFSISRSIFPLSWQAPPIQATGQAVDSSEITRCKQTLFRAFSKYPSQVLRRNLRTIYFLKSMTFYEVSYGGTNSNNALYLTNDGLSKGFTDQYLEQTFHHEFSSILIRNHPGLLDTTAWMKATSTEFEYSDPEKGVGAIRNNKSSQGIDPELCAKGFLTQYAMSGIENDINTVAQNLFNPSENFWDCVEKYMLINKKVKLLINFYNSIDSFFTEKFFKAQ